MRTSKRNMDDGEWESDIRHIFSIYLASEFYWQANNNKKCATNRTTKNMHSVALCEYLRYPNGTIANEASLGV